MVLEDTLTKGERTRQAIEDVAYELFLEQGYSATSMRQIAKHAGIALGGIYNHFKGKDDIFEAIIVDKHPYRKLLPAILEAEGSTVEEFVQSAMQIIMDELGDDPHYVNLMLIEIVEFKGKHGATLLKELAPKALPIFERLIKSRDEFRVNNPAMLLRTFFGMIFSYYLTEMIVADSVISGLMPGNSAEVYMDIFLHGILVDKE
ncbi:MAG: TetR/AcrR family transcriptional regulator [Anaerolineales bacterium]